MAGHLSRPEWFLAVIVTLSMCNAAASSVFQPVSDSHRSAAVEMFTAAGRSLRLSARAMEGGGMVPTIQNPVPMRRENSFLWSHGHIELDMPEAPEKAPRPPLVASDPYSGFEVKAEIQHIFRAPEKRPPKELTLAFLGLSLLPFFGFLVGLLSLGVNVKNCPSSPVAATFAFLFHNGIVAILSLYLLFCLKLDLFTTLKVLGLFGAFLLFVRHRILSPLAAALAKLKSA